MNTSELLPRVEDAPQNPGNISLLDLGNVTIAYELDPVVETPENPDALDMYGGRLVVLEDSLNAFLADSSNHMARRGLGAMIETVFVYEMEHGITPRRVPYFEIVRSAA
jgi:hypothetical protein